MQRNRPENRNLMHHLRNARAHERAGRHRAALESRLSALWFFMTQVHPSEDEWERAERAVQFALNRYERAVRDAFRRQLRMKAGALMSALSD